MPLTKSARSSKSSSRASLLLSLSSRSALNGVLTGSHDRARRLSLGQAEKVIDSESARQRDESASEQRPSRRKSKLNILTSLFSTSSVASTNRNCLSAIDRRRPSTANGPLPLARPRGAPVSAEPAASTPESDIDSCAFDESPSAASNTNGSVSPADNLPDARALGSVSPASQDPAPDFGLERTDSPELAVSLAEGQAGTGMAALHKSQRGQPGGDQFPARVPVPPHSPATQAVETPAQASPDFHMSESRRSDHRSRSANRSPPSAGGRANARAKLLSPKRPSSPATAPKIRSSSAQPISRTTTADHTRTLSESKAKSGHSSDAEARGRVRRSWLTGRARSRSASKSGPKNLKNMTGDRAWIISTDNQVELDYNTTLLVNGDKVPELWDDNGTVLVHLHPKSSNKGPSFKVSGWAIEASIVFHELLQGELEASQHERATAASFGNSTLEAGDAMHSLQHFGVLDTQPGEVRLYLPPPGPHHADMSGDSENAVLQRLIAIRNLFAFLTGQPLVATRAHPTIFAAFLEVSSLLKEFDFMSMDGTTWGEAVDMSFGYYISQLSLADVRHSRSKTLEAVILGERMKCWDLYNEAYTHAVGKWEAIVSLESPLMTQISPEVLQRLERANLEMLNRQQGVNQRLEDFDFPALFAGVANSSEFRDARAATRWKAAFHKMKGFTLDYYKDLFGNWPPKARSKKNPFSESGLNRLVLKALYYDFCSLYDLVVDRENLTPRVIEQTADEVSSREEEFHIKVLRKILAEFDTSSPPVLPPVPFDTPKVPTVKTVQPKYDELKDREKSKLDKNIKDYELQLILHKSYNFDTDSVSTPFLEQFKAFDMDLAKGKSSAELLDNRMGIWLFLYVVIQSLPLLVIDAPDLQFTEGVEYFLCQPPMGNAPWVEYAGATRKAWYQIPGSSVKVELSPDVVMFSVEATFERSHCWASARKWDAAKAIGDSTDLLGLPAPAGMPASAADNVLHLSPLEPPGAVFEDMDPVFYSGSNGNSPASSAPGSPATGPQRRLMQAGSGLRGAGPGYRASFAGLVNLEPISVPLSMGSVDRRSSRIYGTQLSAHSDSTGYRPQSEGGFTPLGSVHDSNSSLTSRGTAAADSLTVASSVAEKRTSTFEDILKDMGNQNLEAAGGKSSAKKKFGF